MGQALGSIGGGASGGSLASAGLGAVATMMQASGTADADNYQAQRLDTAAQYGEVKAKQTGAEMTRSLNTTLGNIDAVRAAAHADPNSPTGAAFRDNQQALGSNQISIAVGNIDADVAQKRSDAAYYRSASSNALLSGGIGAAAGLLKAVSPLNFSNPFKFNPIAGVTGQ
jgi:hypothetical protein